MSNYYWCELLLRTQNHGMNFQHADRQIMISTPILQSFDTQLHYYILASVVHG